LKTRAGAKRPNAREVALQVVRDTFGPERRRAQEALEYRARGAELDARDRAFATELAYGAIKMRRLLDWHLAPYIGDRASSLPPTIQEILRLGAYQARFMRGVEPHAAAYETVNLAWRHGHRGTAGLTNAVLRRLIADAPREPEAADFPDIDTYHGVRYSVPDWVAARLREQFGVEACAEMLAGINAAPQRSVRADVRKISTEEAIRAFEKTGVNARRSSLLDDVIICDGGVADDPEGRWFVQSESSCMPVHLLDPRAGEHIVDMCSGRGRKTAQIVARMGGEGAIESIELNARKADAQRGFLERAGAASIDLIVGDAAETSREAYADAVLLDAPCSGFGILGRHPEARWRKEKEDAGRLAQTQAALLRAAARRVKVGGRLAYSVCSTDPVEGVEAVDAFMKDAAGFARAAFPLRYQAFRRGDDLVIPPGVEGRDGFYIAMLERRG
jgi:16S rRNA (cytosine967-C5)-methyltransferase